MWTRIWRAIRRRTPVLLRWAALTLAWQRARGQQAIVNMPSADITPKGTNFLMHETQTRPWNPGRNWYGTDFYCYGIGHATELAVTNWNAGTPGATNFATGVGFKSSPEIFKGQHKEREIKFTVGQMLVLSHRAKGLGSFSYMHLSLVTPWTHTRLTGGGWAGTKQLFLRNTGNFLAGLEQPLNHAHTVYWVNEWLAGRHDFGFFVSGFLVHPRENHVIVVAYKVANHPQNGRNGLVLEYGLFF